ncbi:MAG TPA: carboxylesterase family protein [Magnetospirillaceae bacterium]|jgi:para-nitrobenzyl esterase
MTKSPLVRDTVYGLVEGSETAGTYSWKGIPFAKPPVGPLRWKAPVEPDAWAGTRPAKTFGPSSSQYGRLYGPGANNRYDETIGETLNQAVGSEDCLTLNIWRPAHNERDLPVIYFIYGGSNVSGYTADPLYDGANLAKAANAVVVTANYRLGILGWLNMPALKTGDDPLSDSGNFGTLDQIQVLKFIQRNIANFGGNPGNITVMGESAGATNTFSLLTSPVVVETRPALFHRAVPLSGGLGTAADLPPDSIPIILPDAYSQAQSAKLLTSLLIADGKAADDEAATAYAATLSNAQTADYMRSKSPAELFKQLLTKLVPAGLGGTSHIADGTVVANTPIAAIKAGKYMKVPVLAGNTKDEGRLFFHFLAVWPKPGGKSAMRISDADRFKLMIHYDPDAAPTVTLSDLIEPSYLPIDAPETGYHARLAQFGERLFENNSDAILNALKAMQPEVWHYRFDWDKEPAPWNDVYGAVHLLDLFFVFGNFGPSLLSNVIGGKANESGRLALSAVMMKSVGAFARTGDPNTPELGMNWPAWPKQLHFDASLTDKQISVS